ncbi:flavodoxin family protein [Saccharicrinis sp. FJH62]|uniref:flavodoxin family protein n=1 Tax=Saccharicrinis sp. FJH62 TaxID=3344657 RepID=UPI0035D4BAD6
MKTLIISYSFTGNNGKLAKKIARGLNADLIVVEEKKKRTVMTILFDVLFNRIPSIDEPEKSMDMYEDLIFVAPVWFGKIATPFRALFMDLKGKSKSYSFISLSAGANGKNTDLEKELIERTGSMPKMVINPLISEILPANPKPGRKQLEAYRLTDSDADGLVKGVLNELN